jgi:hypothetical protein
MTQPVTPYVPAPPLERNPLATVSLILVVVAVVAPLAVGITATVLAATEGAQTPDSTGWAVLAGFVFWPVAACLASPIAIIGIVLAIIALRAPGRRKVAAIVAIVLGAVPALFVFGIPLAWSVLFG